MPDTIAVEVLEYQTDDGHSPFRDWLDHLRDREARIRVRVRINRVRVGNFGDSHSVGGGVNELCIDYGPGYRVYFGRQGNAVVLLLCGGDKRTQSRDIALAQAHWSEYQRRKS